MIRIERISADLQALARFGATGDGIDRPAYSAPYRQALDWLATRMTAAGLQVREDAAGNLIGRIGPAIGPAVVSGSHIDSVPNGGRYDGAVGVLAALEAARCLMEAGRPMSRGFEVIAFADEEGAYVSELGCRAMIGDLGLDEIDAAIGRDGARLTDVMRGYGLDARRIATAARPAGDFAGYVELHVEQGPVLEQGRIDIGVVTGIVGIEVIELLFRGEANHAGTTPVAARRDAFRAAADMVVEAFRALETGFDPNRCRLTYGQIEVGPGAPNVVPGTARLVQEIRSSEESDIDRLREITLRISQQSARRQNLSVAARTLSREPVASMDDAMMVLIESVADDAGYSRIRMPSGAGHDAQVMAQVTPTAMIFVPSWQGISHNPAEFTPDHQIASGALVLCGVIESLLEHDSPPEVVSG